MPPKESKDQKEIRTQSQNLLKQYTKEYIIVEDGIYNLYPDTNMYIIGIIKVIENLKNTYVQECLSKNMWRASDLITFDKDILNPEKWHAIQEARMPKSIIREKRKGMYKCRKCLDPNFDTSFFQYQSRSADEGMTTKVICNVCQFSWKF